MKKLTKFLSLIIFCVLSVSFSAQSNTVQAQDSVGYLLSNINELRGQLGVSPYTLNSALSAAARNHAEWMTQTGQISHQQTDGSTPSSRAQAAGYQSSWVSENIYMGTSATAQSAWTWWLNSPVHYRGITSTNYTEVGIGSATGANGQAFVLVFGNPGGITTVNTNTITNSSAGTSAQPIFVVGVDEVGNIMHEIQPGHTLGDIALIYGYTWDDLQRIRDLNNMTEEEGRNLEIGSVLLVPPQSGTYTPTPPPEGFVAEIAREVEAVDASVASSTPDYPIITLAPPTPTTTPVSDLGIIGTSAVVPEWAVMTEATDSLIPPVSVNEVSDELAVTPTPSQGWIAVTVTPQPTLVAMLNDNDTSGLIAPAIVDETVNDNDGGGGNSPILYIVVALQSVVIGGAALEFWRRNQKTA